MSWRRRRLPLIVRYSYLFIWQDPELDDLPPAILQGLGATAARGTLSPSNDAGCIIDPYLGRFARLVCSRLQPSPVVPSMMGDGAMPFNFPRRVAKLLLLLILLRCSGIRFLSIFAVQTLLFELRAIMDAQRSLPVSGCSSDGTGPC